MTIYQSFLVSNKRVHDKPALRVWWDNILIRAVSGESSVMSIDSVSQCFPGLGVLRGHQEGKSKNSALRCRRNWYLPSAGGELFSVAKPLQERWHTQRKSYYALLALCVVRNLVFAGPQLERGDQNERQSSQQWWRQSLWLFRAIEAGSCRPASSFPLLAVSIGHTFWVELFEASVEREKSSAVSPVVCAMPQQVQDKAKGKRWKWRGHRMWFDYLIASCSFFLARSWGWEVSVLLMPSLRRVRNP